MSMLYGDKTLSDRERHEALYARHMERAKTYGFAPLNGFLNQLAAVLTHRVHPSRLLELKNHPVLVITGSDDHLVNPANSIEIAQHLGIEAVILDGVGHHLLWDAPDKVHELIDKHLDQGKITSR